MMKTYICPACNDKSSVEIDDKSYSLFCGVKGISELKNVRVYNGECTCAFCSAVLYSDK